MKLYLDDQLLTRHADAASLESALARFKTLGHARLRLSAEPKRGLALTRWDGSLFIEVETPTRLDGCAAGSFEEAAKAARDYLSGRAVKTAWTPKQGLLEVVMGDPFHPDCPLCQKAARA